MITSLSPVACNHCNSSNGMSVASAQPSLGRRVGPVIFLDWPQAQGRPSPSQARPAADDAAWKKPVSGVSLDPKVARHPCPCSASPDVVPLHERPVLDPSQA